MKFVELVISPSQRYSYKTASDIEMNILGDFLASDVGYRPLPFRQWAFNDLSQNANGNLTALKKHANYILLTDVLIKDESSTALQMTHEQFVQILDNWQEKVCNIQPKEIIIKHENDQFTFETTLNENYQITPHPTIAPHTYPLWIKCGFLLCCIIFSLYLYNIASYLKLHKKIRRAHMAFANKNYHNARIYFTKLSKKMPYNKEISLYLAQSLFASNNIEDHMTAIQILEKKQLNEREWRELLKYMPSKYTVLFQTIEQDKK